LYWLWCSLALGYVQIPNHSDEKYLQHLVLNLVN